MKRATKFFLTAGVLLASAITFSCSSDDGDGNYDGGSKGSTISCQTSNACVNVSAETCLELQGQLVQSCDVILQSSSSNISNEDVACQEQSGSCSVTTLETCQHLINIGIEGTGLIDQKWEIVSECPPMVGCLTKSGLCSEFNLMQCQKFIDDASYNGLYVSMMDGGCTLSSSSKASSSSAVSSSSLQLSSSSIMSSSSVVITPKCNGVEYNPSTHYCKNASTVSAYTLVSYGGQSYKTVEIGSQTWMAENLNYNASGSVCYDNNSSNCVKYGRLYDWVTAMNLPNYCNDISCSDQIQTKHRGICPSGWHIPTHAEWTALEKYVANYFLDDAAYKLKATNGWNNDGNGSNEFGFSALPGGDYSYDLGGYFSQAGEYGSWWSTSEYGDHAAYLWFMSHDYEGTLWFPFDKDYFLNSIRCVKD